MKRRNFLKWLPVVPLGVKALQQEPKKEPKSEPVKPPETEPQISVRLPKEDLFSSVCTIWIDRT